MADTKSQPRLRETIAAEIRVAMVRRQVTGAALALALGKSQAYVSRRLSGETSFDVDDLEVIAGTLRVKVADLVGHAERGDGSYSNSTRPDTQPYEGQPGPRVPVVTGTVAYPDHPILARAVRLPLDRRTAPTGR